MTTQEYKYFSNYKMNETEIWECHKIVGIVNKHKRTSRQLYYGFPSATNDLTEGYALGSIMCMKKEFGFNYYLFTVGEKGNIDCRDFQEILPSYKEYSNRTMPFDAFIYYLISLIDNYDYGNGIYLHDGIVVKASLCENKKYRLEMLHGYGSGMAADGIWAEIEYSEPVFEKIKCFCGHEFFYCDKNVPDSSKYEVQCPCCKALLMRKKKA